MQCRTDLALEVAEGQNTEGIEHTSEEQGVLRIDRVFIKDRYGEEVTGKPIGHYVTLSLPKLSDSLVLDEENIDILAKELGRMLPKEGTVLIAGLGNTAITPDALGPATVRGILATRHISGEFERIAGFEKLRSVAVLAPGVLGQTGIEVSEIIASLVKSIRPSAVIAIDALASRSPSRLGCTIQICDTGISPGAGVGNNRPGLNEKSLGVPVIAVGVPTVVDAVSLAAEAAEITGVSEEVLSALEKQTAPNGEQMFVTPREIDLIINRASKLISLSINLAMHPDYDPEELANAV